MIANSSGAGGSYSPPQIRCLSASFEALPAMSNQTAENTNRKLESLYALSWTF
jgi:hypothetical protein